jgi:recombination protein RecR
VHGILKELAKVFATLPGLGPRSANRIAITLAEHKDEMTEVMIKLLQKMQKTISKCDICANFCESDICHICSDYNRDKNQICIVSEITHLWAIEKMGQFEGVYHILGGTLSMIDAIGPNDIDFEALERRINNQDGPTECIIAMNPTIQGQATTHYIQELLKRYENITTSALALGMPMGSQLDYLDNGTIAMAMASRKEIGK